MRELLSADAAATAGRRCDRRGPRCQNRQQVGLSLALAIAGTQAAQGGGGGSGQQDGSDYLGHDGARGSISASAESCLNRRRCREVQERDKKMAIGRASERDNPADSTAHAKPQKCLDIVRGTQMGQRSLQPHQQAGHMTAFEPPVSFPHLRSCIPGAVHTCEWLLWR